MYTLAKGLAGVGIVGGCGALYFAMRLQQRKVQEELTAKVDDVDVGEVPVFTATEFVHPMRQLPWYSQWLLKIRRTVFLTLLFMPCSALSLVRIPCFPVSISD
jgi:hypothetical protein